MKNIVLFILMSVILTGASLAENNFPKGKHKSHKKAKKKKSGYYFNFQH